LKTQQAHKQASKQTNKRTNKVGLISSSNQNVAMKATFPVSLFAKRKSIQGYNSLCWFRACFSQTGNIRSIDIACVSLVPKVPFGPCPEHIPRNCTV
jgi:hypothetical protein